MTTPEPVARARSFLAAEKEVLLAFFVSRMLVWVLAWLAFRWIVHGTAFRFHAVKPRVAADIEYRLAAQISGQALPDNLPGWFRMLDRLTHYAGRFRFQTAAQVDAVKPGLESRQRGRDFLGNHLRS